MATRYNTGNPVPSNTMMDLSDNVQVLDSFTNNAEGTVVLRTGETVPVLQAQVAERIDGLTATAQEAITGSTAAAEASAASAADSLASADSAAALGKVYKTMTLAQAAITAGTIPNNGLFSTISTDPNKTYEIWENVDGVPTAVTDPQGQKTYPSGAAVDAVAAKVPTKSRSLYWGGVSAEDGTIGVAFRTSDNRPIFGNGGDLFERIDAAEQSAGSISVYATLAAGMSAAATGVDFMVNSNVTDGLLTPAIYNKNSDTTAVKVFSLVTGSQVTDKFARSGYVTGMIGPDNEIYVGVRESDGAALFFKGGDFDARIGAVEAAISTGVKAAIADAFGDSKTAGTGGTPYPLQLAALIGNGFVANNYGIGGQKSTQIAMRMGAIPTYLTVDGNAIPASGGMVNVSTVNGVAVNTVTVINIDPRLISTPSNNTTLTIDGWLCGVNVRITRTAAGANDYTKAEAYTLTALSGAGVRCLPGSLFVPDYATHSYSNRELWICAGINDYRSGATVSSDYDPDVVEIKKNVDAMVNFGEQHGRKIIVSGLTTDNYSVEFYGGIRYSKILEVNYYLAQKYPNYYVRDAYGKDLRELIVASHDGSTQDLTDYSADITPASLRSDNRHPNTAGYAVWANQIYAFRNTKGY